MQKKNILIVDDEPIIRHTLKNDLQKEEFLVTTAENGEEAVNLIRERHFDLVVTDLSMPGIGGIQVLSEAKEVDTHICVIILTGFGDIGSAIDALRLGANDYLLKPCDNEELVLRINNCLEKQDLQKKIKIYEEILPICCCCKKIRDDSGKEPGSGKWLEVADYFYKKVGVSMTHGMCPQCYEKQINELNILNEKNSLDK